MLVYGPGVYVIMNRVDHKVYIGSSLNCKIRTTDHKRNLIKGVHINKHLQNAWNFYGVENFRFAVLEQCVRNELRARELYWIEKLRANEIEYGYNKSYPIQGIAPSEQMTKVHKEYWRKLPEDKKVKRVAHLTDPDFVRKINSRSLLKRWQDPKFSKVVLDGLTRGRNKTNANPTTDQLAALTNARLKAIARNKTPEGRANQRLNNLAQWKDPKIRAARLEALARGRETQRKRALLGRTNNDIV